MKDPQPANRSDTLALTTAPKPHPDFEEYVLIFSPTGGLLKVLAVGKNIDTDDYGIEIQNDFQRIVSAIEAKYGPPKDVFDTHAGELFTESSQWMMALLEKQRKLEAFWFPNPPVNNVTSIDVEAKAVNSKEGYINVGFEFEGWNEYLDSKRAKQDTSF